MHRCEVERITAIELVRGLRGAIGRRHHVPANLKRSGSDQNASLTIRYRLIRDATAWRQSWITPHLLFPAWPKTRRSSTRSTAYSNHSALHGCRLRQTNDLPIELLSFGQIAGVVHFRYRRRTRYTFGRGSSTRFRGPHVAPIIENRFCEETASTKIGKCFRDTLGSPRHPTRRHDEELAFPNLNGNRRETS
ncbi:MAG: hypothetical protein Ct9H300mP8_11200 [Gammaproteobacteria bacterium]|nr:MAG: hypothetical protein Ct9H300mP8_11200 [Gammaproteobacteria bacterium]